MFQRIREAKVKLNPEKCYIGAGEIGFLGHLIGPKRMRPDMEILKTIQDMPNPQSVRDVRCAMGLFGYYRRFVPNFSKLPNRSTPEQGHTVELDTRVSGRI